MTPSSPREDIPWCLVLLFYFFGPHVKILNNITDVGVKLLRPLFIKN